MAEFLQRFYVYRKEKNWPLWGFLDVTPRWSEMYHFKQQALAGLEYHVKARRICVERGNEILISINNSNLPEHPCWPTKKSPQRSRR